MKKIIITALFYSIIYLIYPLSQPNSLLETGINDYNKGQYSFSINNLKKYIQVVEDNSEKPKAYYYLSLSYYFMENYRLALNYFNELATKYRLSGYTPQTYFWKGLIYQNLGQWQNAEDAFLKYIDIMPNSDMLDSAYLAAANSQITLGKINEAEKNLKFIIDNFEKSDKYEEASVLYAYLLIKNNKQKEADDFLTRWMGKLGKDGKDYKYRDRFWLYYSELAMQKKDYDLARLLLKKIDLYSKDSPSSDLALLRLSQIESLNENSKEAKAYLIRLANEYPFSRYNIDATLSMGISFYNAGEFTDAIVFFKQAESLVDKKMEQKDTLTQDDKQKLTSLKASALFYLGESNLKLDDNKNAISCFEGVIEQNNVLKADAVLRLIYIGLDNKNQTYVKDIIAKYDSVLKNDKNIKDKYLLYRSKYEFLSGSYSQSIVTLDQIDDKKQNLSIISSLKAKNFVMLGKVADAASTLKDAFPFLAYDQKPEMAQELITLYFKINDFTNVLYYYDILKTYSKDIDQSKKVELRIKSDYYASLALMQIKENTKAISILKSLNEAFTNIKLSDELTMLINNSFYYLGWLYYKESDYTNASKYFNKAHELNIDDKLKFDSYYMEAWSYFSKKEYKIAGIKFEEIFKKYYPDELAVKSYLQEAKSYENINAQDKAINIYNKIYYELSDSTYKLDALYEIIKDKLRNKKLDEANKLIQEFGNNYSGSELYKDLLILQAESLINDKRYSEALSVYNYYLKNIKDQENLDNIYYWAGFCATQIKDFDTAKEYLDIVNNNYQSSIFYKEALLLLYSIYDNEKSFKSEEVVIKRLIDIEKDDQKLADLNKKLRALQLLKSGYDPEEARLIIEAENGSIDTQFNLAFYYYKSDNKSKAIDMMKDITVKDSGIIGSKANLLLGDDLLDNQNYKDAIDIYMKNISAYKTTSDIKAQSLYKLAFCYYKLEQKEASEKIIAKLKSSFPDSEWTQKAIDLEKRMAE